MESSFLFREGNLVGFRIANPTSFCLVRTFGIFEFRGIILRHLNVFPSF